MPNHMEHANTSAVGAGNDTIRILIADDEEATRLALEGFLEEHYEITIATDGTQAWSIPENNDRPLLAIIDWMMPGIDGTEICRKVRQSGISSYVYIVMLTAKDGQKDVVVGLDAGADDYLRKPFHPDELRARLRAGERILKLHAELRTKAARDHLTGTLNRGTILEILQRELARSSRTSDPVAVILADLDNFKSVNDTYGHLVGDAVLREAAGRLGAQMRSYDALGRYGGEEFLAVLPECSLDCAREIANRMCGAVAATPVRTRAGDIRITVSLGFALADVTTDIRRDDVISAADVALYRAKREGRNRAAGPGT